MENEEKETESDENILMAEEFFDCSENERIAFELGIKLGAIFHQFIGTPVSSKNVKELERAMEKTTESQAFVKSAEVKIKTKTESELGPFDYTTLTSEMLKVKVKIQYKGKIAIGKMEYIEEMNYPLMYLERIVD